MIIHTYPVAHTSCHDSYHSYVCCRTYTCIHRSFIRVLSRVSTDRVYTDTCIHRSFIRIHTDHSYVYTDHSYVSCRVYRQIIHTYPVAHTSSQKPATRGVAKTPSFKMQNLCVNESCHMCGWVMCHMYEMTHPHM